jgi:hypothetical protein
MPAVAAEVVEAAAAEGPALDATPAFVPPAIAHPPIAPAFVPPGVARPAGLRR